MQTETKSDTPETDRAAYLMTKMDESVHANFARKLERERDEARAMARDMRNQFEKASTARLIFPWENAVAQTREKGQANE